MISNIFGDRLKSARKNKNMTQKELASKVALSSQVISNIERGYTTGLGTDEIKLLANALDVSTDYLLGLTENPAILTYKSGERIEKSDIEDLGAAIKKIFVEEGKIAPNEELSAEFKQYATQLIKAAVALDKKSNS